MFDRFLARVSQVMGDRVILKGGLVLELRLERARTTKDVGLRIVGTPREILERLQQAGRLDLGDFLTFEVRPHPVHPDIAGEGMRYDGLRFRAEGKLAGKPFGQPFGVDVGFAEKLHTYTMPRERENSRVKDLPDLALLGTIRELEAERIRRAFEQTFTFRGTHGLPSSVPDPPASWVDVYDRMAKVDELPWRSLSDLTRAVVTFLDPVLGDAAILRWSPDRWEWT